MKGKKTTLGGNIIRLTSSKVITLVISTISAMLLARFRTLEEYGTYSQLLLVVSLFTTLLMLGLPNSINFFLANADNRGDRKRFLSFYYTLGTIISILIGLLLILIVPLIERYFHNSAIREFYYFLALYPWTTIITASIENMLIVFEKTKLLMFYRIVNSIALLGIIIVIQWVGLGFKAYMIAFIILNCIFAVFVYMIASKLSGGLNIVVDRNLAKKVFAFSIPIGLSTVVGTLNTDIDKLLIGYLMNPEQMGIYTNAAKELPLAIISASITAVLLPKATRMVRDQRITEAIKLWGCASELALIVICLAVSGVFTYAEEVMTIFYSAKYLPGVSVFRVYTLNLVLRSTYFGLILNAYGKTRKIFYCSIISLGLNTILNPLFFWAFGMIGPAIATFVSILVISQLQLIMTSKETGIQYRDIFPWKKALRIISINSMFAMVFFTIKRIIPFETLVGNILESVLLGCIWSIIYLLIMKNRILKCWHYLNNNGA